jgi:hypothetical protein
MKYSRCSLLPAVLALACTTASSDGDTGTSESETETGDEQTDGHGTVAIQVFPIAGDASLFEGTTEVVATVHYQSCLQDFYLGSPEYFKSGPEGAPIFEAWLYKLCADFENTPECLVDEISQAFILESDVYTLMVTYSIGAAASLSGSEFRLGPLPTSELAGCEAGVEVQQAGLIGRDTNGTMIWRISTLPANNTAVTDQDTPLVVEVVQYP